MTESTTNTSVPRAALLFYAVATVLLLAVAVDIIQDDGFDWVLFGAAAASLIAGVVAHRAQHR